MVLSQIRLHRWSPVPRLARATKGGAASSHRRAGTRLLGDTTPKIRLVSRQCRGCLRGTCIVCTGIVRNTAQLSENCCVSRQ